MSNIKIKCPNCNENINVEIDENFNIYSIKINDFKISKNEIKEYLLKNNIELG